MSYISQNISTFNFGKETANISRRFHDFFCTIILSSICKQFATGGRPYTAEALSKEHKIPIRLTKSILYELQDMRLIYEAGAGGEEKSRDPQYLPGIDIHQLSVGTLLSQLDTNGAEDFKIDPGHYSTAWQTLIQARKEFTEKSSEVLLKDL